MKKAIWILLLAVTMFTAGCTEGSIDSTLNEEGVENSMVEGKVKSGSSQDEASVAVRARWQPVVEMKGTSDKRSKRFKVNSPEWRISWSTEPSDKEGEFFIFLFEEENSDPIIITTSPDKDMAEMEGTGEFFIEVKASQPYNISVSEFK